MYLIDYENDKTYIHKFNYSTFYSDYNIMALKGNPEEYLTYYVYCLNNNVKQCYPLFRKFKFESDKNEIKVIKEYLADININSETNFICNQNYGSYILCVYSEINDNLKKYSLGLFNSENLQHLSFFFDIKIPFESEAFFNSMINLDDKAFVMSFLTVKNITKV